MNVHGVVVGAFEVNCWLAWGDRPEALVVDPGADAETILQALRERRLRVAAYLLTHGHMDHVSALDDLCDAMPAPVVLHAADAAWAFAPENQWMPFYPPPRRPVAEWTLLEGETTFSAAGFEVACLSTPGHTPGSVCYQMVSERVLFSGDTLFAGSIGRTDFPGSDPRAMTRSLRKLAGLDDAIRVYPGHGPATSLGREKTTNVFLTSR